MTFKPIATALLCMLVSAPVWAYETRQGERLSALLMREKLLPGLVYAKTGEPLQLSGMLLKRAELIPPQTLQKTQLLTLMHTLGLNGSSPLGTLVQNLPVTGRQLLPSQDAHEMVVKPPLDPVLQAIDTVTVPARSAHVAVVSDKGFCVTAAVPLTSLQAYLDTCFAKSAWYQLGEGFDWVWLVKPSGEVQKLPVGLWNRVQQIAPEPGSWIVAPSRGGAWPTDLVEKLSAFLATQGVVPADIEKFNPGLSKPLPPKADIALADQVRPLGVRPTRSDWGNVGLLQMPSARMSDAGTISVTASRVEPYSRYSFIYQPFDWLEAGFRYSIITNRSFGAASFSGDRKYQDKSVDLKLRLLQETAYLPQLAFGLRDIGGTGLFSSEYLVASKRTGTLDFTLGLGFGNMASSGGVSNPFTFLSEQFRVRPQLTAGIGGEANSDTYFRGPGAIFGGVEWQTPWSDLIAKLELDGNDYSKEPLSNPQEHTSPFNYGLVYRVNDSVDFTMGVQRGTTMSFALAFKENVSRYAAPKLTDPKPVEITAGPRPTVTDWKNTLIAIEQQTTWSVQRVQQRGSELQLVVENPEVTYPKQAVDKATAVLHENTPENVNWFSFSYKNRGLDVAEHVVDRRRWMDGKTELTIEKPHAEPVVAVAPGKAEYREVADNTKPWYKASVGLGYQQTFGGANGYLFQFTAYGRGELRLGEQTWLAGRVDHVLGGTFDKFTQENTSLLPRVRTQFRDYARASDTKLSNLQLNHVGQLADNHFYSLYGGYLEPMFGGVGGEYLYRPFNSRLALGIDLNRVRQRAFEQDFDFQRYTVNTGHVTAYVDTGFQDILASISVGQYLAGDRGATLDLSRVFKNGVKIGAYASKTNVSAEQFGEGSFDKGIYVRVPFDALFTSTVPGDASFVWTQVTRDGAAKLQRGLRLFDQTELRDPRALSFESALNCAVQCKEQ